MGTNSSVNGVPEELTLPDILKIILKYKTLIFIFPVLGIFLSFLLLFFVGHQKPKWRANALVSVDHYDQSFQAVLTDDLFGPLSALKEADLSLYKSTILAAPTYTNLVKISVDGHSQEEAKSYLKLAVNQIAEFQKFSSFSKMEHYKSRMTLLQKQIQLTEDTRKGLEKIEQMKLSGQPGENFLAEIMRDKTLSETNEELLRLYDKKEGYEEKIKSIEDQKPHIITVRVTSLPVRPAASAKRQIVAASGFLGLLLGVFFAFLINSFRKKES